jgi:phage shock protein E
MVATIARDEVQRLVAEGTQLVEVLPAEEFEQLHIAGAINIPLKELDGEAPRVLDRERAVIVYCNDFE